jgi:hypothetical protein
MSFDQSCDVTVVGAAEQITANESEVILDWCKQALSRIKTP